MKNLSHLLLSWSISILFSVGLDAQALSFSWHVHWGTKDYDTSPILANDDSGSVYCAGTFKGTLDFDPGPASAMLTSGFGGFGSDTYISKFDSTGHFLWVRQVGGVSTARAVLYDSSGYLLVLGEYTGATDFDPGPGTYTLTPPNNSYDAFLLKLDADGHFVSAYTIGGNGQEYPGCMARDPDGNVVIGGLFSGTSDFDPGPGQSIFTSGLLADLFMVKLDSNGVFIWAKEFSGDVQGDINAIALDSLGNAYVTGIFDDRRDFDPGPDSLIVTATGYWDVFIAKLNSDGALQWLRHLGNLGDNWSHDLIMDTQHNIYITGYFSETLDFDPGPDSMMLTATYTDPYILKMTSDGALIWAKQIEGLSYDQSRDITMDRFGDLYITGWFGEVSDFDPGPGQYLLTSTGGNDMDDAFIAKYNKNGDLIWANGIGGTENDNGMSTSVDRFGHLFIAGAFQGRAVFYPDMLPKDSLQSNGASDAYLVRWRQCLATTREIYPSVCDIYTSPSGKYTWDETGMYYDTLTNAAGCDSILTIHLTVAALNNEVILTDTTLVSQQQGGTFQWVDCEDGFAEVPGANSNSFTPEISGTYAVVVGDGICADTSGCIGVIIVGTEESTGHDAFRLYPNPAQDYWVIDAGEFTEALNVEILDPGGRCIFTSAYKDIHLIPMTLKLNAGLYFVNIKSGNTHAILKLVIY